MMSKTLTNVPFYWNVGDVTSGTTLWIDSETNQWGNGNQLSLDPDEFYGLWEDEQVDWDDRLKKTVDDVKPIKIPKVKL